MSNIDNGLPMTLEEYKQKIDKDEDLVDYLIEKEKPRWLYERYLYFHKCLGDKCKYADACVKLLKEEIDEFYSRRATDNIT